MRFLLMLSLICSVANCASSGTGTERNPDDTTDPSQPPTPRVTSEDIARSPGRPIVEVLSSRFPGVVVTRGPNGGLSVRIRGTNSINATNEPLYVIDGVPIEPGPGGALFGINPYDIESIEVLKNAAETAMYGVRGANGVIVIKTKGPGD